MARGADTLSGNHSDVWNNLAATFDAELAKCKDGNYEFSVLAAEYIAQLDFLAPEWLHANLPALFPIEYKTNFDCAISGLPFATLTQPVFRLLVEHGVFDRLVRAEKRENHVREQLIEWIALGYLWGDGHIITQTLPYLFEAGLGQDLRRIAHYFWRVRKSEELSSLQVERVLVFWERCVEWAKKRADQEETLGCLALLAAFLPTGDERGFRLLLEVAPFAHMDHGDTFFVEELERLVEGHPREVLRVLQAYLSDYTPSFDYGGRIRSILTRLMERMPDERCNLIPIASNLRDLPGMPELYVRLRSPG